MQYANYLLAFRAIYFLQSYDAASVSNQSQNFQLSALCTVSRSCLS